jgi:uncharacterized membrane-anchored protein
MSEATLGRTGRPGAGPGWQDGAVVWLRDRKLAFLAAAGCLQGMVLLAMIALRAWPLLVGDPLVIRVVPVDPRDLFRGDYVVLSYAFSVPAGGAEGLTRELAAGRRQGWEGRTVYVSLVPEPDGIHWRAERTSLQPPAGGKFIRGRAVGHNRLEFGIEAFYVQEGVGRNYERAAQEKRLSAEIALTSSGQAALRGLRVE